MGEKGHARDSAVDTGVLNYIIGFGNAAFIRVEISLEYFRGKDYDGFAFSNGD